MTDLSRYADWTAWLTAQAAADPDVHCVWVGGSAATGGYDEWSDLDLDVLCTPGTSTAVYTRWLEKARTDFDIRGVWAVPEHVWPDGRQCLPQPPGPARSAAGADADHRPARLRPGRPPLAPRRTPARHADRAARPRRADRPRGGGRQRGAGGRGRPGPAAPGDGRVAGEPGHRPGPRRRGRRLLPPLRPGLRRPAGPGASTARGATTSGCATCARTCHPTWPTRSRSSSREPPRPRSRSCRCVASRGWTSSWPADSAWSAPARVSVVAAVRPRAARAAVPQHHEPEDREAEQEEREVRDR